MTNEDFASLRRGLREMRALHDLREEMRSVARGDISPRLRLSPEDYAALAAALENPPEPNDRLRALLRRTYDPVLTERIPDDIRALVEKLK